MWAMGRRIRSGHRGVRSLGVSANLLDYPEENGLKSDETEGRAYERYADQR